MQPHVKDPYTQQVYRLQDLLDTCKASSLNLIMFKNIVFESSSIYKSRVITADTRYPIVLTQTNNNKYLIVDGNHRYLRMRSKNETACIAFVVDSKNFAQIKDSWNTYPPVNGGLCGGCGE